MRKNEKKNLFDEVKKSKARSEIQSKELNGKIRTTATDYLKSSMQKLLKLLSQRQILIFLNKIITPLTQNWKNFFGQQNLRRMTTPFEKNKNT